MALPSAYSIVAPALHRAARFARLHHVRRQQQLRVRHAHIPTRLALRIVVVADIHGDEHFMPREDVASLVDRINEVPAVDAVMLVGDFVGHDAAAIGWVAAELARLGPPAFASLGNHDRAHGPTHIAHALERTGVTVLVNGAAPLPGRGDVWIGGLDSMVSRPDAGRMLREVPDGARCIVLGHEPALALQHDAVLHLAGHTHHGQIGLPGIPWRYLPRGSRPFPAGLYALGARVAGEPDRRRWVLTTAGVGSTTIPLRLGCPPEIVVLDT